MSTHRLLTTVAGSLLCAAALRAENTVPATASPAPGKAEPSAKAEPATEPYQLKNRSSFACPGEGTRAPFWPIGWVHRKGVSSVVASVAAPKSALDEKSFRVTSILLGSGATPSLAVINGRAYSEGEFLKVPRGTTAAAPAAPGTPVVARIRVQRISDGNVVLQQADQVINVAIVRPEVAQKKTEEPLLDDER